MSPRGRGRASSPGAPPPGPPTPSASDRDPTRSRAPAHNPVPPPPLPTTGVTQFLAHTDFYRLWNWFDDATWYPLGRVVGGTVYPVRGGGGREGGEGRLVFWLGWCLPPDATCSPLLPPPHTPHPPHHQGLIWTAGTMYRILHALNLPIHVQEVCVFTAPLFSALTALSTFALVREVRGRGAGLVAAALMSVVPSYVSRSVAGSFDNEGVAIFALITVFFLYVKTLKTGSLAWATALCLSYLYMVASWGGYTFIINLLPIHALACVVTGRLTPRLYAAYAPLIIIGTLEAASIPVVGFNAVLMSEHFGAFVAFAALHAALAARAARALLPPRAYDAAIRLGVTAGAVGAVGVVAAVAAYRGCLPHVWVDGAVAVSARPHLCCQTHPHHRLRLRTPAPRVGQLLHRPPLCRAAGARGVGGVLPGRWMMLPSF